MTSNHFLARIPLSNYDGISICKIFLQHSSPDSIISFPCESPTVKRTYQFIPTITICESILPTTEFCLSSSLLCTHNFVISFRNKHLSHFISGFCLKCKALLAGRSSSLLPSSAFCWEHLSLAQTPSFLPPIFPSGS